MYLFRTKSNNSDEVYNSQDWSNKYDYTVTASWPDLILIVCLGSHQERWSAPEWV